MAFTDADTRKRATNGLAKYTFRVAGSTDNVEITSMNETELMITGMEETVPSGYFNPKGNMQVFGLDFIASKLYEDIFGKTFYTGGGSVGLITDINENNFLQNVKTESEYRPSGYFGLEG